MPDVLAQRRWWLSPLSYLVLVPLFAGVHASVFSLLPVPQPRSWLWTFVLNPSVLLLSLGAWCLAACALGVWLRTWWWPPICLVATVDLTIGWGVPFSFRYAPYGGQIGPELVVFVYELLLGLVLAVLAAVTGAAGRGRGLDQRGSASAAPES